MSLVCIDKQKEGLDRKGENIEVSQRGGAVVSKAGLRMLCEEHFISIRLTEAQRPFYLVTGR